MSKHRHSGHSEKWAGHPYAVTGVTRENVQHVRHVVAASAIEAVASLSRMNLVFDRISCRLMSVQEASLNGFAKYLSHSRRES